MDELLARPTGAWRRSLYQAPTYLRRALPFTLGVAAAFVGLLLYSYFLPPPQPLSRSEVDNTIAEAIAAITPAPAFSSSVYQVIRPSLVLIQVAKTADQESDQRGAGLGSGVVIDRLGSILTSLHVVTNSLLITATFADGSESLAEIVAVRPESDIAVLLPVQPPPVVAPAVLGNPMAMHVGDEVYAVGHPLGLYASLSAGVISGFGRTFRPPNGGQQLEGLIQIDAAVNPGNSGGPLLNRSGHVVGIVTGLANPTDENFFIGIGFAVPINVAVSGGGQSPPY